MRYWDSTELAAVISHLQFVCHNTQGQTSDVALVHWNEFINQ